MVLCDASAPHLDQLRIGAACFDDDHPTDDVALAHPGRHAIRPRLFCHEDPLPCLILDLRAHTAERPLGKGLNGLTG